MYTKIYTCTERRTTTSNNMYLFQNKLNLKLRCSIYKLTLNTVRPINKNKINSSILYIKLFSIKKKNCSILLKTKLNIKLLL